MKNPILGGLVASLALLSCSEVVNPPEVVQTVLEPARASGVLEFDGYAHPYLIEGEGIPCVVAALGPIYRPLFSDRLKEHIQFIYVDFKNSWGAEGPIDPGSVTMESLWEDIDQVRQALGHERICVVGHSAPGMMPMAYALSYPEHISHAISLATVPFWNAGFGGIQAEFWDRDASAERRAARDANQALLSAQADQPLTARDTWVMSYVRNGPLYWFDPSYDCYWIFAGHHVSMEMVNHFFGTVLADYDLRSRLGEISAPVFLAQGRFDYATPYHLWEEPHRDIPDVAYHVFDRSAHFPMFEEQDHFDDLLIGWLAGH
jgi:proline iminopeptidase